MPAMKAPRAQARSGCSDWRRHHRRRQGDLEHGAADLQIDEGVAEQRLVLGRCLFGQGLDGLECKIEVFGGVADGVVMSEAGANAEDGWGIGDKLFHKQISGFA